MPVFNKEKLPILRERMLAKAEAESRAMKMQTERLRAQRLEKAKSQALQDAYQFIQVQQGDMNLQATAAMSQRGIELRKKLISQRDGCSEEIFQAVRRRLEEFALSGEAYETYRKDSFSKATLQGDWPTVKEAVVYLSPRDMKYKELIQTAAAMPCRVEPDERIRLGGFILEDPVRGQLLVETLEERLNRQKEWFYRNSGFTVEVQF